MKKLLLVSLCFLMLCITQVFAQNRTVTGTVTAKDDGLPIPGVSVKIKGTNNGVQTTTNGKYTISVPTGGVLVFSFIGYATQQQTPNGAELNVVMDVTTATIGEVVVTTSLGIKHSEKELGYAVGNVNAKQLTETDVTNIANGLTAKVSGLAVYSLDNSIDPNVSIVLRGNRSLTGDNTALIVLDGVPLSGGSSLSSINPNDVADVSILKGASAAALYGSEASNGAIIVTTKRGTGGGKPIINYENSYQFQKVAFYPRLQTAYGPYGGETNYLDPVTGQTQYVPYENQEFGPHYNGSSVILGAPLDSANGTVVKVPYSAYPVSPIDAFFQKGFTEQNDISFQQGDAANSIYISAQNAYTNGIVPKDNSIKNAFSVRGHRTYGIFSADFSVGYTKTNISTYIANNNPFGVPGSFVISAGANDLYSSILQFPAFYNLKSYQNPDSQQGNVNNFPDAYAINPYWIVNHARRDEQRDVLLSNLTLKLTPTKWVDISYRISDNFGIEQERLTKQEVDFSPYAISDFYHAGNVGSGFSSGKAPGYVADYYQYGDGSDGGAGGTRTNPGGYARIQGDALANFHYTFFKDLKTSLLLGNTVWQEQSKGQFTGTNSLLIKDFYNVGSAGGTVSAYEGSYLIRQIAYYGDLNLSYKGWLTVDATLRNEQDSRLSKSQRSFSYPSGTIAFIPTEALPFLKDNKVLSYAKLYASISRVGLININPYNINPIFFATGGFPYGSLGGYQASTSTYSPTLKPELTTSVEYGAELQFFNDRLSLNYTYYDEHDKNQTVYVQTSIATGFNNSLLNIGETESSGHEVQLTAAVLTQAQNKVGVTLAGNFSVNFSKVISLFPNINQISLGNGQYAVVGQPFPLLKGTDFVRDPKGHVVVDPNTGYPSTNSTELTTFGRTTPKYDLGLTPTISYKFVSLAAVFEYRGGNVVNNGIGGTLTFAGSGYNTAQAGRLPFVYPNSVIQTSPGVYVNNTNVNVLNGQYGFWQSSAYSSTTSPFVTNGAFWKLRELSLAFNLNQFIKQSKYIKGLSVAFTGRNLFIWVPKENVYTDPEFSDVAANSNLRGVNDANILPGTRVFGADLKVTF